jgi:hypothetical protein
MLRYTFVIAGLLALTGLSAGGCQSCSSCHDYDPPVAHGGCGGCGSACSCGCDHGGCANGGCGPGAYGNGGCSHCGCDHSNGAYAGPGTAPNGSANGAYATTKAQTGEQASTNGQQPTKQQPAATTDYPAQ